jgi:hypothetical protein
MTQIKITATDQELNVTEAPVLASGGVNETEVVFTFDSTWTSYTTKTAVFFKKDSETAYHQLLSNSKATVPQEVLVDDGVLFIGVFGQASSTDVKTSSLIAYKVVKGAITTGISPIPPTSTVYQQIIAQYQSAMNQFTASMNNSTTALAKANSVETEVQGARGTYDSLGDRLDDITGVVSQTQSILTEDDMPFFYEA